MNTRQHNMNRGRQSGVVTTFTGVMILVLLIRPEGLFGVAFEEER